jgi:hypothetical protein
VKLKIPSTLSYAGRAFSFLFDVARFLLSLIKPTCHSSYRDGEIVEKLLWQSSSFSGIAFPLTA